MSASEFLFIGGGMDGRRVTCKPLKFFEAPTLSEPQTPRRIGAPFSMTRPIRIETYVLTEIGGATVYVLAGLDERETLTLLIDGYNRWWSGPPTKRK